MAETLFSLTSLLPLPLWAAMLLFPRSRMTERAVVSPWPFIVLAALHALALLVAVAASAPAELGLSMEALLRAASDEWGFLALWSHLLILDLFTGVWIFRDARYWGTHPAPYLLGTLFAGPVGLGAYLLWRRRRERRDPIRHLN